MPAAHLDLFWESPPTDIHRMGATGVKSATWRRLNQVGDGSFDASQRSLLGKSGYGIEKRAGVWMTGRLEKIPHIRDLAEIAGIHDPHPVTGFGHDTQVMGNQ